MDMKVDTSLVKIVSTIVIPATTGEFVANEMFVLNDFKSGYYCEWTMLGGCYYYTWKYYSHNISKIKGRKGFIFFNKNFINWFLAGRGKIENPIGKRILYYHKLKALTDTLTIKKLCRLYEENETTLAELFRFIGVCEKAKNKDSAVLFGARESNCRFWIRDKDGVLRSIYARLLGDGGCIEAGNAVFPNVEWYKKRDPCNWQGGEYAFFGEDHTSSETV